MQFNDTDHEAFADLAKSCLIEFSSYADLATKLETHIESLDDGMRQAEADAENAREDAEDASDCTNLAAAWKVDYLLDALGALACERVELCVENGQRLYVTDGESVHVVMCLRM